MTESLQREIADLTPEQRELLALRLGKAAREAERSTARTAAGTAEHKAARNSASTAPTAGDRPRSTDEPLQLSFTQEQLWFLDRLDPGTPAYNVPFALRLTGLLDVAALAEAINAIVARHEALRTVFSERDGLLQQLIQVVRPHLRIPLPVVDLRSMPAPDRQEATDRESAAHAAWSFSLTDGPLLSVRLLVLDESDHLLLITVHHIVFDAWSADIFTRELVALYAHFAVGEPAQLTTLPTQFGDHVRRRRDPAAVRALDDHLAYWKRQLAGTPPASTFPPDRRRPAVQTHRGGRRTFTLPPELTQRLLRLARSTGVTLNAVVLAAFAALLRQANGQDDIALGMPAAGRGRTELEPLIGCFANMLVLRIGLSGEPTVRELISRAHRTVSSAYAHQEAPYARVVEEVAPPRDPSRNPLFQVMVTVAEDRDEPQMAGGLVVTPTPVENGMTDFDIFVTLTRRGEEIHGVLDYNVDLYLDETADAIVARLPLAFSDMADQPDSTVGSIGSLRRATVALTATFTADLVREPLDFWLQLLRLPAGVETVGYGQMVPHLLAGATQAATVCLLRWEDWLRHRDPDESPATASAALDEAMRDLENAAHAYRRRSTAPLLFVVCPASPRFQERLWARRFSRLDDRLALLRANLTDLHIVWAADAADAAAPYSVAETFDARADQFGHVPYTAEYSALLAMLAARLLWRAAAQTERTVLVDSERTPWTDDLARLLPRHRVVPCAAGQLVDRLSELIAADQAPGDTYVALDPDPATVEAVRRRHPQVVALVAPDSRDELQQFVTHVWVLDPPASQPAAGERTMLAAPIGPERAAYLAAELGAPADVVERLAPTSPRTATDHPVVAPRTPTEQRLAAIWQHVLRVDEVGVTADFFTLGGHSLLATQLLSQVQLEFGWGISLYTLFTRPTIEQLAQALDEAGESTAVPLLPAPRGAQSVASSTQHRLWALAQLDDDVVRHNTTFAAQLAGELDEVALHGAVDEIVARHEVLRTTFVGRRGEPVPVVHDHLDCWLDRVDLADEPGSERTGAVRAEIDRHVAHAYDLAAGPLLRVRLVRAEPGEHYLLVGMHHIICDNTSWSIFLDELVELYAAFVAGQPSPLAPLGLQFTDFAYHQQDWLDSDDVAPQVAYWRAKLHDAPALIDLPTDYERPSTRSDVAGHQARRLPAGLGAAARELGRAEGVTPFTVLLAAFAVLLQHESGASDLVLGVPTAGRDRPELERLIGCFTDLLPFRLDLAGRPSFRQLLRRVHSTALAAYQHQSLPFAKIVEALRLPRDPSRHPVFQCVFNLLDLTDEVPRLAGLDVVPLEVGSTGVDFDLFLTLSWVDDDLQADLAYSADLFTPDRAVRLVTEFGAALARLLDRPDEPIDDPRRAATPRPVQCREPRRPVTVAASFPVDRVLATVRFWSGLLGPTLSVASTPPGQVLRPLLDPDSPLGADPDGLNVVLLRWEDWLSDLDTSTPQALPAVLQRLDLVLHDLGEALKRFRDRSDAPMVLGASFGSAGFDPQAWAGVGAEVTRRLRRLAARHADVEVVALAPWARRYAVAATDDAKADIVAGTVIARRAHQRWRPRIDSLVLDPARLAAPAELAKLVHDQANHGRQVVLTSAPTSPDLTALLRAGAARLAAGDLVAQLGSLARAGVVDLDACLVLDPDEAAVAALRDAHPEATAIQVEPAQLGSFAQHMWLLDPPARGALPAGDGGAAPGSELNAEIATELRTADAIESAIEFGYRRVAERRSAAPRTERERVLAAIWADLLRLPEVGIHDDFLELGGDSLLAMRVVFRAAEAGITLTARQLVAQPTIAELCAAAAADDAPTDPAPCAAVAEQGVVDGDMPLTPAQSWFFAELAPGMTRPAHFNHPYYLELRRPIKPTNLALAVDLLAAHHDALRLRFLPGPDGTWRQHHVPLAGAVPFTSHDLSTCPEVERERTIESLAAAEQTRLDLIDGPTVRVVHFRLDPALGHALDHEHGEHRDRLLIVAHHLVVDAVSRGILLDDLQTLCGQLERGEALALPGKTTSYRVWAHRLKDRADTADARDELSFWLDQGADGVPPLPQDDPAAVTTLGTLGTIEATLTADQTIALHEAARRLRVGIRGLLVWAVARAVADRTGDHECSIATTGHGREDLFEDVDVSRTVGWFQVLYPIRLRLPAGGDAAGTVEVAAQLGRVPRNGIGYGLLRFACSDPAVREQLAAAAQPQIAVNYMGDFGFDEVARAERLFDVCPAPYGAPEDESGGWPFRVDVVGSMVGGRLRLELSYGTAAYRHETVEELFGQVTACLSRVSGWTSRPGTQIATGS